MSRIYAVATMDTKGIEIAFVAERVRACGVECVMVDVGTNDLPTVAPEISREQVTASLRGESVLGLNDRGAAVTAMSAALVEFLRAEFSAGRLSGVIGIGGGGGTALITPAMRALPVGVPKVMVSTMASGNVGPYVDCADLTMMYSVVDVAGINSVSRRVLANAAHAIAGMVQHSLPNVAEKPTLGMTMFGVTTPCVDAVRKSLEARGYDGLVFHATGSGDRAMENLVRSGLIQGVIDVTTTAVADEVVGGVLACGPHRFDAILDACVPYVLSVGALDMVNFGARETVPPKFSGRKLHVHNAQVTLMRTTPDENRQFACWIANKLNRSTAPLTLLIPELGISSIDAVGQPFHDPIADAGLFDELERSVQTTEQRTIKRLPLHINDPAFAAALVYEFQKLRGAEHRLAAIREINEVATHACDLDPFLQKTLDVLFRVFPQANEGGVMLRDKDRQKLVVKATKSRQRLGADEQIHFNTAAILEALKTKEGLIIPTKADFLDIYDDFSSPSNPTLSPAAMYVPLMSCQFEPLGVMQLTSRNLLSLFHEENLELLVELAAPISLWLETLYQSHRIDF